MRHDASLPPDYFENMFAADPDPWRFETSDYERKKYDHTIAALGDRDYARALEIGCANGVLTQRLAALVTDLTAIDVSSSALEQARRRCADLAQAQFHQMVFPAETPTGRYDLIVLSEVAYYWNDADLNAAGRWMSEALEPGGDVLLVHWTGPTDYPQTGDAAVEKLAATVSGVRPARSERAENYRLDLWRRDL